MTNSLGIGKDKGTLVSHDDVGLAGQDLEHYVYLLGITSWRYLFLPSSASQGTRTRCLRENADWWRLWSSV